MSLLRRLLVAVLLLVTASGATAAVTQPGLGVEELQKRHEANPSSLQIRYLLAKALVERGRNAEAVTHFQAILAQRPVPAVMFQLGVVLAKMGDLQSAVFQWDEIVKKHRPNNLTTLGYLGLALHKLASSADDEARRFELHMSALDYFKRIIKIDPGNARALTYAGMEYAKLGKTKESVVMYLRALRVAPKNIKLWVAVTQGLWKLQMVDKTQVAINKILALDPSNVFARQMQEKLDKLNPEQRKEDAQDTDPAGNPPLPPPQPEGPLPNPETGQVEAPPEQAVPQPSPPSIPPPGDAGVSIQAEQLFLDGLDFKEKGNFEKALYSFLQAIDLDPKFSQVYLQIGEVYLALAKLAPTKTQFEERIQLSVQALKKVTEFTPGSLLAHAARAKEVLVTRLQKEGFSSYHLTTARKAVEEDRPEDAFEEYVLLLSNAIYSPEIFFELGAIMSRLTGGNLQDVQFFLEELYGQHKENYLVEYLLAKTYARLGKVTEAQAYVGKFVEHAEVLAPHIQKYVDKAGAPKTDAIDFFISAKLLIKKQDKREAVNRLVAYLKVAKKDDPFFSEATKLRSSLGEALDAGQSKSWEDEKKEILKELDRLKTVFSDAGKAENLDEKVVEDLKVFLANNGENQLARFLFAWANRVVAPKSGMMQSDMEKTAEDTFNELLAAKQNSPDWHVQMGVAAVGWGLPDNARAHLKVAGDLLLLKGRVRSARHAKMVLEAASKLIERGKSEEASILIDQAKVYDSQSLNYHLIRYQYLASKGRSADGMKSLVEMGSVALGDPWFRLVVFTDLGLILFRAVLIALLVLSALLVIRYFEDLHHLLSELWQQKGMLLPFSLAIGIFLVLVFPTGLVVFLPALTWQMLRADEKRAYLMLMAMLLVIPLVLPVSFSDNFDLLRQAERVRSGDVTGAREFFEKFLKAHPGDYNATYLLGLVGLLEGDPAGLESARKIFKDLSQRNANDAGTIVNLGYLEAMKGDTTAALDAFNKALGKNPANVRALFNISSIYARAGQTENMEKYLRWARSVARGEEQLSRYESASFNPPRLLLMADPLDEERLKDYFTMAGTFGLLSLDGPIVLFLCWFLFGGGLVGFLIFTRERLDVLMRRCHHCMRIVCNACQKVQDGKPYCVHCADETGRKATSAKARGEELRTIAFKKAAAFNAVLPGSGLVFIGHAIPGLLASLLFLCLALAVWSGGGWLANYLYTPVDGSPLRILAILAGLGALAVYAAAQAAFYGLRGSVQN